MKRVDNTVTISDIIPAVPALEHIVRPRFIGSVVASFVLPLDLCKPQNAKRGAPGWLAKATRIKIAKEMFAQCAPRKEPLPGRPQVLCVRLSSSEPDKYSDWAKTAIDTLCSPNKRCKERLNLIKDDAPKFADVCCWWEPAKRGNGLVYMEVRTGENETMTNQNNENVSEISNAAKRLSLARYKMVQSKEWVEYTDAAQAFNAAIGNETPTITLEEIDGGPVTVIASESPSPSEQPYDDDTIDGIVRRALSGIDDVESALTVGKIAKDCELNTAVVSKALKRIGAQDNGGQKRGKRYYIPVIAETVTEQ